MQHAVAESRLKDTCTKQAPWCPPAGAGGWQRLCGLLYSQGRGHTVQKSQTQGFQQCLPACGVRDSLHLAQVWSEASCGSMVVAWTTCTAL